jgi:PASTA domain
VPSFTVTAAGQRVSLDASGTAKASFTVTNTSAQMLRGRLLAKPSEPAKADWLSIAGESIRDFAPNAAEQVVVQVGVPPGTPPGSYSFRLDAVSEVEPDEDFTEGPSVAFDVAAPPPPKKKKFPWWILAIIGGVLLLAIVIGVVVFFLTRDDDRETLSPVPPVTTLRQPEAQRILAEAGFTVAVVRVPVRSPLQNLLVLGQDPLPETQAPAGTVVTIRVGQFRRPIRPPPFRGPPPPPPSQ